MLTPFTIVLAKKVIKKVKNDVVKIITKNNLIFINSYFKLVLQKNLFSFLIKYQVFFLFYLLDFRGFFSFIK